jgi:hypothetical protein
MLKIDVRSQEHVYLTEQYNVMSSHACCQIGVIEYDWQDYQWVFTFDDAEKDTRLFQEELEEILYVVNKLNKRDKCGKYKKPSVMDIVHKQANEAIDPPF